MKNFEIEIRKTQFMTVKIEAESLREAIDKAEDPDQASWFDWTSCENATYEATHVIETPNN